MLIHVLQRHIDQGQPTLCRSCPLALAIDELQIFPGLIVFVESGINNLLCGWLRFIDNKVAVHQFSLPFEASEFIYKFDSGIPVYPFSFELDLTIDYISKTKGEI
jgi:hypothetical protein